MSDAKKIVIAGGGTGGHIYPGLAIAQSIKELSPSSEVRFVGAKGGMEERIVPQAGYPLNLIRVGKLHNSVGKWAQIKTLLGLPLAMVQSIGLLLRFRPDAVLGVGGFASGPYVLAARLLGVRTFLWEPNAQPGWTNRMLSRFVKESLLVFEKAAASLHGSKIRIVGLPVRPEIRSAAESLPVRSPLRLLIFGGSQGAVALNDVILQSLAQAPEFWRGLHFVHQTGRRDFERVQRAYASVSPMGPHEVLPYLDNMPQRLAWADLVICRSGASTVAEICAARKPALFVPFPYAADDHQRKNAEALVEAGAAEMILQQDLTPESLQEALERFQSHPERAEECRSRLKSFDKPGSGREIAQLLLEGL